MRSVSAFLDQLTAASLHIRTYSVKDVPYNQYLYAREVNESYK